MRETHGIDVVGRLARLIVGARLLDIGISHWGAFRVLTNANRIVGTEALAPDPHPSAIPDVLPATVHHRSRVAGSSIRRGWL